jgi:hypothetical protein
MHGFKRKLGFVLILLLGTFGLAVGTGAVPAHANGSGNQWCNSVGYCFNAWNGGPFIRSYGYGSTITHNDFSWVPNYSECNGGITTSTCPGHGVPAGQGIGGIQYTGGGSWNGQCVGDAYNDPGRADTSLDPCGSGWGTNYVYDVSNNCGSGWVILYDIHWNGLIYIPDSNGGVIYQNNSGGSCIHLLPYAP